MVAGRSFDTIDGILSPVILNKGEKMDFGDLLKMGADLIQNNSDEATTGLDTGAIGDALSGLFG